MKSSLLMFTTLVLSLVGCRLSEGKGDLKDLENYTRSEFTPLQANQCKGFFKDAAEKAEMDNWLDIAIPSTKTATTQASNSYFKLNSRNAKALPVIESSLRKALSAVPVNLQQAYFATGGEIVVDDNAKSICTGEYAKLKVHARTFVGEGRLPVKDIKITDEVPSGDAASQPSVVRNLDISGCWVLVADKFDSQGNVTSYHPQIVLNSAIGRGKDGDMIATEVEHSTVRLFGYLLSQILAHIDVNVAEENVFDVSEVKTTGPNDLFTGKVKKLLAAVRADVARNPDADFFYYKDVLAKIDAEKKKIDADKNYKPSEDYQKLEMAMHHYTFAESFDSYYCNNTTNATMQTKFANAYKIFFDKDGEGRQVGLAAELDYIRIDDKVDPDTGSVVGNPGYMFASLSTDNLAYQYAFQHIAFLRLFRGIGRFVGAVFRGIGRFVVGAVRAVANVVGAAVRMVWNGVQWVARAAVGLVRGALYVTGRVVGHVYSALAPVHSSHLAQYRGNGPFRRGFLDATRVWYPVRG